MKEITAIIRSERLDAVKTALEKVGCKGITIAEVKGRGEQLGIEENYRGTSYRIDLLPKIKITSVVSDDAVDSVSTAITEAARTGSSCLCRHRRQQMIPVVQLQGVRHDILHTRLCNISSLSTLMRAMRQDRFFPCIPSP